jgi:hypothetical protein
MEFSHGAAYARKAHDVVNFSTPLTIELVVLGLGIICCTIMQQAIQATRPQLNYLRDMTSIRPDRILNNEMVNGNMD